VLRGYSKVFWYFINHGGRVSCEVTGRRRYGKGLEVPCVYKFFATELLIVKLKGIVLCTFSLQRLFFKATTYQKISLKIQ